MTEKSKAYPDFSAPINEFTWIVDDMDRAMRGMLDLGIGPWYTIGPFCPPDGFYKGCKSNAVVTFGLAFSGDTLIELIQQHDNEPSVFGDRSGAGDGLHHIASFTPGFADATGRIAGMGIEQTYRDSMGGSRLGIFETRDAIGSLFEVIELGPVVANMNRDIWQAARDWDGTDPVRPIRLG